MTPERNSTRDGKKQNEDEKGGRVKSENKQMDACVA